MGSTTTSVGASIRRVDSETSRKVVGVGRSRPKSVQRAEDVTHVYILPRLVSGYETGERSTDVRAEWHTSSAMASVGIGSPNGEVNMMQNLATLNLSTEQLAAVDTAIAELERQLSGLVALSTLDKRRAAKLGEKSEFFCRQTLQMLQENPQVVPPNLNVNDAIADLQARDALRPRLMRLTRLLERGNDTEFALGSDAMAAAMRGYGLLKSVSGREGLDGLRKGLGSRFSKSRRTPDEEKKAA